MKNIKVKLSRWPWQNLDPHWSHGLNPPQKWGWGKVPGVARFGGGWDWKFGVAIGGRTIIADLMFGSVRISWD